jgi:hypothetical protein
MSIVAEANLVDLADHQLKETIGGLWERIRRLEDAIKTDPEIMRMTDELNLYKDENYRDDIKLFKAKLKAARKQAEVRGIQFKLPGDRYGG